jgi:hypothetical protein
MEVGEAVEEVAVAEMARMAEEEEEDSGCHHQSPGRTENSTGLCRCSASPTRSWSHRSSRCRRLGGKEQRVSFSHPTLAVSAMLQCLQGPTLLTLAPHALLSRDIGNTSEKDARHVERGTGGHDEGPNSTQTNWVEKGGILFARSSQPERNPSFTPGSRPAIFVLACTTRPSRKRTACPASMSTSWSE